MPQPAQPAVAADRFAREIVGFLKVFSARSRHLNTNPLGGWGAWSANPFRSYTLVSDVRARCARLVVLGLVVQGVVRRLVVLLARCVQPARVPGVIPSSARYAGVIPCWCGMIMPL